MIFGPDSPLKRELAAHELPEGVAVCLTPDSLDAALSAPGLKRLVFRSTAYLYGSSEKNPGLLTEDRVSLLDPKAREQAWLRAEERALAFPNAAILRFSNILAKEEGDLVVRQLSGDLGVSLPGFDPNVQFVSVRDAARALAAAAGATPTGIFNISGAGVIPLKKAFRASGTDRIPIPGGRSLYPLQYNWTVSGERAERELGFTPGQSTMEAFAEFVEQKSGNRISETQRDLLHRSYDEFGLDLDYIRAWGRWFAFLRNVYWRIDHEGLENVPETGRAMFVSNHRGFMPLDAVMHLSLILTHRKRVVRFLIIPSLLRIPFLCNFLTKLGGVIANQTNAARLFDAESLVGIFPEGIRGPFTPYKSTYKLRDFAKSAFAKIAIENQSPILPCAVVGHSEIFPIIKRIDSSYISREFGWPYFPIAPMFPLAPVPIPSKWHLRMLEPVPLSGLKPADAENVRLVRDFSRYIQDIMQRNIDDMRLKRKSWFWGHVLDGTHPPTHPFEAAKEKRGSIGSPA
jgi:1-acyl-sn-glycerol-3-phosphate acyltransferase